MKKRSLYACRSKRRASRTSEPFGQPDLGSAGVFVVQQHAARRMHYDLRLEMDGVLKSWAVPRGPSVDPKEKRLAVQTEDHPLEYQDFEGLIPNGNYGAGAMIVWDKGQWIPLEGDKVGLEKGKLLFELRGYKLRGVWTLFKTAKQEKGNEWLLMKKPDGWARDSQESELPQHSVLSGLTVEELLEGGGRCAELVAADVPKKRIDAGKQRPMLAQIRERPFTRDGWIFELKYDGFRLLASKSGARARLFYRHGREATHVFPEITRAVSALPAESILLDGEVVVLDEASRPSFQRLQKRTQLSHSIDIQQAAIKYPATFFAFDLLQLNDYDLKSQPLIERKHFLEGVMPPAGPLRYCDHIEARGEDFFDGVENMGLEGVVAKKSESKYRAGRSSSWLKIRVDLRDDFTVAGYTLPKGARGGFGALHLAHYRETEPAGLQLVYAGRVGTGFSAAQLGSIYDELQQDRSEEPAITGPLPSGDQHVWVTPRLVCEVRYKEITEEGLLRQPSFLGGCGRTRLPRSVSRAHSPTSVKLARRVRRRSKRQRKSLAASASSISPISTSLSGPTTATARATWSSTTAQSLPGYFPTFAIALSF